MAVDLRIGESQNVVLPNGEPVTVKLVGLEDFRDTLRGAVRRSEVKIEVAGQQVTLGSATYHLPVTVGNVQIDCPITKGYVARANKLSANMDAWGLEKDARLRALARRCAGNRYEDVHVPGAAEHGSRPARKCRMSQAIWMVEKSRERAASIITMASILAAPKGWLMSSPRRMVSSSQSAPIELPGYDGTPVAPRYDVVYLLDDRGWFYRYSHLHTIATNVKLGQRVRMGDPIGLLGKEGGSGGWSHLHFDISGRQPSGKWGIIDGYAFLWEANLQSDKPEVDRGRPAASFCGHRRKSDARWQRSRGQPRARSRRYEWTCTDGQTAVGERFERTYAKPGIYSEILKITDSAGAVDYDFAFVDVVDREHPEQIPPSIHPAYAPTQGIKPGDTIKFLVRTFGTTDGEETWDFGDGSPKVTVHSDGNVAIHAKHGYAITTHKYDKPGIYLARVERSNDQGLTAVGRLKVVVE